MLAEVDAFAHALVAGFVLPEDFDTPRGRR
jgi:hypothetical protein